MRVALFLAVPFVIALGIFFYPSFEETQKQSVEQAYFNWKQAIQNANGDPDSIKALYAPDAILLATMSPQIKHNPHKKAPLDLVNFTDTRLDEYFASLSALNNINATTEKLYIQLFDNIAINTGLYTFNYTDHSGNEIDVPARFTFVYKYIDGEWLIINHHSSHLPAQIMS